MTTNLELFTPLYLDLLQKSLTPHSKAIALSSEVLIFDLCKRLSAIATQAHLRNTVPMLADARSHRTYMRKSGNTIAIQAMMPGKE
ncbi:MAG: hypothetical protein ACYTX0_38830, partial [Nostoc sp.]